MKARDPMERLARDLCWFGFSSDYRRGKSKVYYWKSLPEAARQNYRYEAARFAYLLNQLDAELLNQLPTSAQGTK